MYFNNFISNIKKYQNKIKFNLGLSKEYIFSTSIFFKLWILVLAGLKLNFTNYVFNFRFFISLNILLINN